MTLVTVSPSEVIVSQRSTLDRFLAEVDRLRQERGAKKGELYKASGVTQQAVSLWRKQDSSPELRSLVALARALGATLVLGLSSVAKDTQSVLERSPVSGEGADNMSDLDELADIFEQLPERERLLLLGSAREKLSQARLSPPVASASSSSRARHQ